MSTTHSQVLISSRPNFGKNTLLEENLVYVSALYIKEIIQASKAWPQVLKKHLRGSCCHTKALQQNADAANSTACNLSFKNGFDAFVDINHLPRSKRVEISTKKW